MREELNVFSITSYVCLHILDKLIDWYHIFGENETTIVRESLEVIVIQNKISTQVYDAARMKTEGAQFSGKTEVRKRIKKIFSTVFELQEELRVKTLDL